MKTYSPKLTDIDRQWYILDASKMPLGRMATRAASLLIGKAKVKQAAHIDLGDYVVIINAAKLVTTGEKSAKKLYYRHSGFPGGLRQRRLAEVPADEVIFKAIRGMLPVNKLRQHRLGRLKIYLDENHPHEPQQPTKVMEAK